MRWITAALIVCGAICAQERGTPVFDDNFDVKGAFPKNWKPTAGVKNENGVLMLPAVGGRIFMKRKMPEEFYATVRLKLSQPDPDPKKRGGFAGFSVAGRVFVIRQDGKAWMVYKIPGQKNSGGAIQKIADFEFGKFYTLTLIRKSAGTDKSSSQWTYLVDGKMIGQAVIPGISENAQLSIFTYRTDAGLDDFQLSGLKEK
jgi:hypothetical protein